MNEFYINIALTFVAAGVIFYFMDKAQKRKEKEADEKFEFTMKMIELRNRKCGEEDESKK